MNSPHRGSTLGPLTCATHLPNGSKPGDTPSSSRISPDIFAVGKLLSTMKRTVATLATTFDALSAQTAKVMDLAPAIQDASQVSDLKAEVHGFCSRQAARFKELVDISDSVVHDLTNNLQSRLAIFIREAVEKNVEEKVRQQLSEQIPESLRQQGREHRRQILEIQTNLHNSEARRHNSTLRSESLTDPLHTLLRPLTTPVQSPGRSVPPTPLITPSSASTSTRSEEDVDLEPPTPSPAFPKTLGQLFNLSPIQARELLMDYGLLGDIPEGSIANNRHGGTSGTTPTSTSQTTKEPEEDWEHNVSKFMAHIGVRYQMLPPPPSKKKNPIALTRLITSF